MNDVEAGVMREHAAYWSGLASQRIAIVVGPVLDPRGPWGVGIVEVPDEEAVQAIAADDPAIKSGIGLKYEIYEMPRVLVRGS
jgi:uncharacterized protein YciI